MADDHNSTETVFEKLGTVKEVPPDGNCMLYALQACIWADQDNPQEHTEAELIRSGKSLRLALGQQSTEFFKKEEFNEYREDLELAHEDGVNSPIFNTFEEYKKYICTDQHYLTYFELKLFADNKQRPVEVYDYMPVLQDFQCRLKYSPESSSSSTTPLRLLHVCYSPEKSLKDYVLFPEIDVKNHFVPIIKFTRVEKEKSNSKVVLQIHDWLEDRMKPIMRLLNDEKGDYIWKKKKKVSPNVQSDLKSMLQLIEKEERNLRQLELQGASQEDIQHKKENIGVHFKAIWNMLTAVASITEVPLDTSNKPEVVIPIHKQSEDDDSLPTKGTYDDYRDVNKIDEKPVCAYLLTNLTARFKDILSPENYRVADSSSARLHKEVNEVAYEDFYNRIALLDYNHVGPEIQKFVWGHCEDINHNFWAYYESLGKTEDQINDLFEGNEAIGERLYHQRRRIETYFTNMLMNAWVDCKMAEFMNGTANTAETHLKHFVIYETEIQNAFKAMSHGLTYNVPKRIRFWDPIEDRLHYIAAFIHCMNSFEETEPTNDDDWLKKYMNMQDPNKRKSKLQHTYEIVRREEDGNYDILGKQAQAVNPYFIALSSEYYTQFPSAQLKSDT